MAHFTNVGTYTADLDWRVVDHSDQKKRAARQKLESVGFDMHESQQYMSYALGFDDLQSRKKGGFRWLYLSLVGFGTGCVAACIQFALLHVNEWKEHTQEMLYESEVNLGFRYLAWISTCLVLASIAGFLVCYVEPCAAGSGIPEIKCVLNGIDLPNVLRGKTLIAKAVGIVASVAAGLPCGKEGPMIHSGAIVGAQATKASAGRHIPTPYRLTSERRDFVAAGAAAGVAAAFGAPIGGVLFAVEEGATHMNPRILLRTFVCAAIAGLTVRFFAGPIHGGLGWGKLGTEVPVEFGRFAFRRYNIWELLVFAAMGVAGGLLGGFFNWLNTRITYWRMKHVGGVGLKRFFEALFVTLCIVSFNFFAPLWFGGSTRFRDLTVSQRLFVMPGAEAMKELFHSQESFDVGMLAFFSIAHYFQTIWTYGLGVPSGLFVPSLLGGAAFGRLVGEGMQHFDPAIETTPGLYALVGAAAMLSGAARITISLTVLLMETTGEAEWSIPIFMVTVCATWVGNWFNKGIYDIHIDLKHVPLLEEHPPKEMLSLQAQDLMSTQLTTISVIPSAEEMVDVLATTTHSAFPVVERDGRFVGLVERSTLMHILVLGEKFGIFLDSANGDLSEAPPIVPYVEMLKNGYPALLPMADVKASIWALNGEKFVRLLPYTNQGCYTVQEHSGALRCHNLYRSMGLRHLPVLNESHVVVGMITRKDIVAANEHVEHNHHQLRELGSKGSMMTTSSSMSTEAETSELKGRDKKAQTTPPQSTPPQASPSPGPLSTSNSRISNSDDNSNANNNNTNTNQQQH
mmetsp:Transcript_54362/g.116084  ORF Transcript_54362/g.116084 Transcript_54362/m.116084 type:complete len:798 (+) Transcript_54362:223-2616(+)|eukprot:CAMPEP_0206439390 /NCGR_PEP_ID=MMETSP0324_2-20121206/12177_1 /ASSEMBLY_ACC=CAM_ASM_000836 /TAXON_ID=2866 /ORGANISM="Crypthecodinium cohnii, Strain Seligo" /LENGTH=797 /DNA_ID=CAMNT_0053906991 /DNA_START=124 /DNA_END=2517 /DNA_ORIENTATION=-